MTFTNLQKQTMIDVLCDFISSDSYITEDCGMMIIRFPMDNIEFQFRTYTNGEFSSLVIRWVPTENPKDETLNKVCAYIEHDATYFEDDFWNLMDFLQNRDERMAQTFEALDRIIYSECARLHLV